MQNNNHIGLTLIVFAIALFITGWLYLAWSAAQQNWYIPDITVLLWGVFCTIPLYVGIHKINKSIKTSILYTGLSSILIYFLCAPFIFWFYLSNGGFL